MHHEVFEKLGDSFEISATEIKETAMNYEDLKLTEISGFQSWDATLKQKDLKMYVYLDDNTDCSFL